MVRLEAEVSGWWFDVGDVVRCVEGEGPNSPMRFDLAGQSACRVPYLAVKPFYVRP
jgi:hypothetical protein